MSQWFAGFRLCLALAWRRNRVFYLVWGVALVVLMPATVASYRRLGPEGGSGAAMLDALAANPTMRAMLGPPFDLTSAGGFTMWRVGTVVVAALALMAGLGVIRATRAEEETGRLELLRSAAVGRHAPLAAGWLLAVLVSAAVGGATAAALVALDTPASGAVAVGLGLALTGALWASLAALFAQVFTTARAARGWALGVCLGVGYLLRAFIDGAGAGSSIEPLRWGVPLEWAALTRPYAGERWWVLILPLVGTAVLAALALRLETRRDFGAGLVSRETGPAYASASLRSVWGLSWRLERGAVVSWTIGIVAAAIGLGSLGGSLDTIIESNNAQIGQLIRKMGGGAALTEAFYVAILGIMAVIIALAALLFLSRPQAEEAAGRAEPMLATATSRLSHLGAYLVWAAGVPAALLLATGALLPLIQSVQQGDWRLVAEFTKAAAVLLPGVFLVLGVALLLLGWRPRLMPLAWVLIGWSIFCIWFGALLDLPQWLLDLQPWGYLPRLPSEAMAWRPVLIESALSGALLLAGAFGYRRRDIT